MMARRMGRATAALLMMVSPMVSAQQRVNDLSAPQAVADPASGAGEPAPVPSDFDINSAIVPPSETGALGPIPGSAAPDNLGAFRFLCMPGQLRFDDPIVFPGQPGQSHLHQFFGNLSADAHSTYDSLRKHGDSTCMNALNRSAYWMPAMLNGRGQVVRPDYVTIYYKRLPTSDPECQRMGKACVALPRGLRFVFGFDMVHPKAPVTGQGYYNCGGRGAVEGHYKDLREAARHCPSGTQLGALINAPGCWDGKHLDSPDHRAHVAYATYVNGQLRCPRSHPYVIPTFTLGSWYTVDNTFGDGSADTWHLSSDEMADENGATRAPGSTFHADWFGAWDDDTMRMWMDNCIDKLLSCSTGELGNGRQLKQVAPFAWQANPRLVPIPPREANTGMAHH